MPQPQHQELSDIINDIPAELLDQPDAEDAPIVPDPADDEGEEDALAGDPAEGDDALAGDDPDAAGGEEDDEEDYFTNLEDDMPIADPANPAATAPVSTTEDQYILSNLPKISVRIVAADDSVQTLEVYSAQQLPRDMKGFATPYEGTVFNQAVLAQEQKARELQTEYRANQTRQQTESFIQRENKMIADDLTDLRREGIFPKFKGIPGSKEFNDSEGAKTFDKVVAYMNEQNDLYSKNAQNGKAYRHIGFREAYVMLHGPNTKAAEKADMTKRRAAAAKVKSGSGTAAGTRTISTERVGNINDLAGEFAQFAGNAGANQ